MAIFRLAEFGQRAPARVSNLTSADEGLVGGIRLGTSGVNTLLSKAILDNLITMQDGSDFSDGTNAHTHDGRYFTEAELSSTTSGSSGATLLGADNKAYTNITGLTTYDMQDFLDRIDVALGVSGGNEFADNLFRITDDGDSSKKIAFEASAITTATTRTVTMPDANVDLGDIATNTSNISTNSSNISANTSDIADIRTTTGTADGDTNMGTFTGTTISDNVSTKAGMQELETAVEARIPSSEKGAANGVATLDGSGKMPSSQLPTSATEYKGAWNASTNSPTLADGVGTNGDMYRISVAGTQDLGSGNITFAAGDAIIYNGSVWEKIPGEDIIQSVNGQTGVVVLDSDDVAEGSTNFYYTEARFNSSFSGKSTTDLAEGTNLYYTQARFDSAFTAKSTTDLSEGTNLYFTDERAQDAVGGILTDTATIDFTYNDAGNQITADLKDGSVTDAKVASGSTLEESLNFFNATDISGSEAETLTDGSNADALHGHSQITSTYTNNVGSTIVDGSVVRSNGVAGEIALAQADTEANAKTCLGTVDGDILDTASGSVTRLGKRSIPAGLIEGSAFTVGAEVYLSDITSGKLTTTAPTTSGTAVVLLGVATGTTEYDAQPPVLLGIN